MVSFHELERWSGAPLDSAASEASGLAKRYKDVGDQILDINNADLSGEFVEAEMRRRRALADDASDVSAAYQKAQTDFEQLAQAVSKLVIQAKKVSSIIHAAGGVLTSDGKVRNIDPNCQINLDELMTSGASLLNEETDPGRRLQRFVNVCLQKGKDLLNAAGDLYDSLAHIKKMAVGPKPEIFGWGVKKPNSKWGVEEVNDWWTAMSVEDQKKIIKEHPDWIGNLDGIPTMARHKANVLRLEAERDAVNRRVEELARELKEKQREERKAAKEVRDNSPWNRQGPRHELSDDDPLSPDRRSKELRALLQRRAELNALSLKFPCPKSPAELDALLDKSSADYSLMAFDSPKDGHLRAVVGIGDVDHAKHLQVHTPGMNSSVYGSIVQSDGRWGGGIRDMDTVLKAARAETAADHGESGEGVAGVYNLNYDAPSMGESLNPDRSVLGSKQADIGARKLAGLCDGLQATHAGDPHMVVTGHSYGSTVAGKALRQTTAPDDFIAYGSPGFEAVTNSELNMVPGHTSIGGAEDDKVAWSGWHQSFGPSTPEPHNNLNYEHFSTDKATDADGVHYSGSKGHSEYMNNAENGQMRTSVKNIASVVAGNGIYFPER